MRVKFQPSISDSSRNIRQVPTLHQNLHLGIKFSLKLVPHYGVKVHTLFSIDRGGSARVCDIVCDGGDC